jgi:AcrR family transcriptional regulator
MAAATRSNVSTPPVVRNPARSRQAILDAATKEFSECGLGGARVDRIAKRSGVNKRLIYHYIGNKEALFLAVLEQAYANIRAAEQALHLDELSPIDAIRRLIEFTWDYYLEHPEFLTLLNSENLHRAKHLKQSTMVREMTSPLIALLDNVLKRGRREGVFRTNVDPVQLYISIAGLAYFYLSNNYTLSTIFSSDFRAPKARADRVAHMSDLVVGYLLGNAVSS